MAPLGLIASAATVIVLPMIALIVLLMAKLSTGPAAVKAQRRFFAVLIVMTLVTAHTVMTQNAAWFIHTLTLAIMIVGSLWSPPSSEAQARNVSFSR